MVRISGSFGSAVPVLVAFFSRRSFPLVGLAVSLALHLWVIVAAMLPAGPGPTMYRGEFVLAVGLAAALEPIAIAIRRVTVFRFIVTLRLVLILIALNLLGTNDVVLSVFLTLPLLLEIIQYDEGHPRIVMAAGCTIALMLLTLHHALRTTTASSLVFSVHYGASVAMLIAGITVLDRYREQIVAHVRTIRNLESTAANLSTANIAFQSYADNLESESAEKERNRITAELHDTIGYTLTNVIVMMQAGKILLEDDPDALAAVLDRVGEQSDHALTDIRQTLHRMRSMERPDPKGLDAIYRLTRAFEGATGISVEVNRGNIPLSLGHRLDTLLFRLVQEALTNAFRHGEATTVSVFFWRSDEEIRVNVRDNGTGVAADTEIEEGIGLKGLRERLREFGGTLRAGGLDAGFELVVKIPFRRGGLDGADQGTHS